MLACLQLKKEEFSLVLSDDDQLHQLNKIYRGKDRPTDVLSFPMREGDFAGLHAKLPSALLGDVIVSVPTARKQAIEQGKALLDEVTMLIAHGLLHLLGWDHDTPAKDKRMRAETARLCEAAEGPKAAKTTKKASTRAPANVKDRPSPLQESKTTNRGKRRTISKVQTRQLAKR